MTQKVHLQQTCGTTGDWNVVHRPVQWQRCWPLHDRAQDLLFIRGENIGIEHAGESKRLNTCLLGLSSQLLVARVPYNLGRESFPGAQ